jgi:vitamin B12 transporter
MFRRTAPRAALCVLIAAAPLSQARADSTIYELPPLDIVTTADRVPEPIGQTGSSITVVPGSEIEKFGTKSVADVLRDVASVQVVQSGGVGGASYVGLRGAGAGRTLVLIDGVRVGDSSSVDNALDFGNLSAVDIERIEVLRGPQSALYGSDAMGGVINIITRKGSKKPRRSVTVDGGSYGTIEARGSISGADDRWTYSLGIDFLRTQGFPRYGYRIGRPLVIGDGVTPLPPLPDGDPASKGALAGRFSYKLSEAVTIDMGLNLQGNAIRFDNPFAVVPSDVFNPFNHSQALIADGFVKATIDPWNGLWKHQITVFGNLTNSDIWEAEGCYNAAFTPFDCRTNYRGGRYGAEYQGDANFGPWGAITYGAQTETETAQTGQNPNPNDGSFIPISAEQTTNSAFALYRYTAFQRLDLTLGGRVDAVENGPTFPTWRATAAYHIDETGTKLRASVGTGAKEPTLYQRFSPYGTPGLLPETNIAYDAGIDQKIFAGRATLSATYFFADYQNLINFASAPVCTPTQINTGGGCYYNIGRARTQGAEFSADMVIVADTLRAKASYTYTDARDLTTGLQLLRVPFNQAGLSFIYTPTPKWEVEPRLTLVGSRFDTDFTTGSRVTLAAYATLDVYARYKINESFTVFGRVDNLTDARYEEIYNYGTPGRSFYGGLTYNW